MHESKDVLQYMERRAKREEKSDSFKVGEKEGGESAEKVLIGESCFRLQGRNASVRLFLEHP